MFLGNDDFARKGSRTIFNPYLPVDVILPKGQVVAFDPVDIMQSHIISRFGKMTVGWLSFSCSRRGDKRCPFQEIDPFLS